MKLYIILSIIIFIILLLILQNNNIESFVQSVYDDSYKSDDIQGLKYCSVPTLNTEQCYKSRYFECPIVNGSHLQCTNNYIPKPSEYNADCGNRTFEMVPPPHKISENCYYDKINFNRNEEYNKVRYI